MAKQQRGKDSFVTKGLDAIGLPTKVDRGKRYSATIWVERRVNQDENWWPSRMIVFGGLFDKSICAANV